MSGLWFPSFGRKRSDGWHRAAAMGEEPYMVWASTPSSVHPGPVRDRRHDEEAAGPRGLKQSSQLGWIGVFQQLCPSAAPLRLR